MIKKLSYDELNRMSVKEIISHRNSILDAQTELEKERQREISNCLRLQEISDVRIFGGTNAKCGHPGSFEILKENSKELLR